MHHDLSPSRATDCSRFASLFHCPKCKKPRIMSIKAIRRAVFRGEDLITYECIACGTEKTEILK